MQPPYEIGINHPDHPDQAGTGNVRLRRVSPSRWRRPLGFTPGDIGVAAAALLITLATVAGVVWMLYEFLAWLFGLLGTGADKVVDVGGWLLHGPVTSTVAEPVSRFLHSAPTAAAGDQLWHTWLAALLVLFIAAVRGSRGGRIGWVVLGVATAYMAWRGGGEGAAITTVLLWALLSVPAFAGTDRSPVTVINHIPEPDPCCAGHDSAASTDADSGRDSRPNASH